MILIISPAKRIDPIPDISRTEFSQLELLNHTEELISILKNLNQKELAKLLKINPELAQLNYERYVKWGLPFTLENSKQALFVFKGDVYRKLDADSLSEKALLYGKNHLRILSGLYGILRPLDLIQPYRLEMGTRLQTRGGSNLYEFWGNHITDVLVKEMKQKNSKALINLASNEYFKVINLNIIKVPVITPIFKDFRNGTLKIFSIFAKEARGMMSRFILENQLKKTEDLKLFNEGGYAYDDNLSSEFEWVFTR